MAGRNEEMTDLEKSVKDIEVDARKRSDSDTVFTSPKCLIEAEYGDFRVNQEILRQIATVEKKLVVIAIAGLYRTGKSYLLTRLAGKYSGFPLGNAIQSKTKGIWVWCVDHPLKEDEQLLLLDTEGLGDIEKGDENHDNKIFAMATLLCSTLIYNAKGAFDQHALRKLSFIVNLAKNVKVNDKSEDEGGQLDIYLPDFILVLRDYFLDIEVDGKPATPDKYLEHCLTIKKGVAESSLYNEARLRLRKFFKSRKCFTMAAPGGSSVLKHLESLTDKDLEPDFVQDIKKFLEYVHSAAKPFRTRNETPINGSMFVNLVEIYTDAFAKGTVPCIDKAFKTMASKANEEAIATIFDDYMQKMKGLVLPTKDEFDLLNVHTTAKEAADEKYLKLVIMDDHLEFKEKLSKNIQNHFTQLRVENKKSSSDKCERKLKEVHDPISQKVKSGEYLCKGGYEAYQADLNIAKEKYYSSQSIGFMKESVFLEFLEGREDEKQKVLWADMQLKEAEKQQKLAEEAARIAAEQERLKKLEEEKIEREKRKEAELKALEMDNLMKKMQENMENEKRKMEEALRKKEKEYYRLEAEGLRKEAEHERKEKELMKQYVEDKVHSLGSWVFKKIFGWLF